MTIAYVQDNSALTSAVTLASASGAGHLLVCCCRATNTPTNWPTAISDGANTWTFPTAASAVSPPAVTFDNNHMTWLGYVTGAASATTVTITENANPIELDISEFSGVGAAGPGTVNSSTANTNPSISGLTYSNGELIVLMVFGGNAGGTPTGFTEFSGAVHDNLSWCYQIMSGSGTLTANWTTPYNGWGAVGQVFHLPVQPAAVVSGGALDRRPGYLKKRILFGV